MRRILVVAALACLPAPTRAAGAADGCEKREKPNGDLTLRCSDAVMSRVTPSVPAPAEETITTFHQALLASQPGTGVPMETTWAVAGQPRRAWTMDVLGGQADAGPVAQVTAVVVARADGGHRVLSCTRRAGDAQAARRCQSVFESWIKAEPPPAARPAPGTTVDVLGAQVTPPPGCEVNEPTRLRCGEVELKWRWLQGKSIPVRAVVDAAAEILADSNAVTPRPCAARLRGQAAECRGFVVKDPARTLLVLLVAGELPAGRAMAQCTVNAGASKDGVLPSPCRDVIEIIPAPSSPPPTEP